MRAAARRWKRWRRIFILPSSCLPRPDRLRPFRLSFHGGLLARSISPAIAQRWPRGDARHAEQRQRNRRPPEDWAYRAFFGPAGQQLGTQRMRSMLPPDIPSASSPEPVDRSSACCRSRMMDGCRCEHQLDGMADHRRRTRIRGWCGMVGDRADDRVLAGEVTIDASSRRRLLRRHPIVSATRPIALRSINSRIAFA